MDNNIFGKHKRAFLIGADDMFYNGNWSTIEAALDPEIEVGDSGVVIIPSESARPTLMWMAVSRMPEEMKRKYLPGLSTCVNFHVFAKMMRVKLADIYSAPVSTDLERMIQYGLPVPELIYRIHRMTIEEINGLINWFVEKQVVTDVRITSAIILRIYDEHTIPHETLLLTLALCHL